MKISKIAISNVIGIARADIVLKDSVLVVAADNAQGKSSIADAISMAFIGKPRRVDVKKDLGQLLHDDAAKGRVSIEFGGADEGAEFRLPKGEQSCSKIPGADFVPYVLDSQLFNRISADERRTLLFSLTNCKASGKIVSALLEERGVSAEIIEDILPMMRGGFPAASKECYAKSTQFKGAWRQITGENWGSKQSEGWKAQKPAGDIPTQKELDEIMAKHQKVKSDLDDGIAFVGQQTGLLSASKSYAERLRAAQETADLLPRRATKLKTTEKDLAEWEKKLPVLLEELSELQGASEPQKCPCCQEELRIVGGLIQKFEGLKANTSIKTTKALEVTNAKSAIQKLKGVQANDQRDVAESQAAAKRVEEIKAENLEVVDEAKLQRAQEAVGDLRTKEAQLRAEFNAKQQLRFDAQSVDETTGKAAKAHDQVKAWLNVGDALAPDGIPAQLLGQAMTPVNDSLAQLAGLARWYKVVIRDDMSVTYGGRLYGLCSESEKWRADTLLALAIAQISQLRMVVLDRFDVLDMDARKQLLGMLRNLGQMEAMDTMIMCGTMKAKMNPVPGISSVWIENGIAELGEA